MKQIEIILTTTKRPNFLLRTLKSLQENTNKNLYNLTVVNDGCETTHKILTFANPTIIDDYLYSRENIGLAPSFSKGLGLIKEKLRYFKNYITENDLFLCYLQDDLEFQPRWLEICLEQYNYFKHECQLGFVTGHNAPEHKVITKDLGNGILLKPWIRATHMMAPFLYWESMLPIPIIDPETGRERAKPNNGVGSGFDWAFIRNHENSVTKTNRVNLVIPGLVKHIGYKDSTWLKQDLPEI